MAGELTVPPPLGGGDDTWGTIGAGGGKVGTGPEGPPASTMLRRRSTPAKKGTAGTVRENPVTAVTITFCSENLEDARIFRLLVPAPMTEW